MMTKRGNSESLLKSNSLRPRPQLSWSQFDAYQWNPAEYRRRYILGESPEETSAMRLGKRLAEAIETQDGGGDPVLSILIEALPKYPIRDKSFITTLGEIPLLIKPDGLDTERRRLGEYKSGRHYTQGMADKLKQIDFYCAGLYARYGWIPHEITLIWVPTVEIGGKLQFAGNYREFATKRSMADVMSIYNEMVAVWEGIGQLCTAEYKNLKT